jgi:hypothetical protein
MSIGPPERPCVSLLSSNPGTIAGSHTRTEGYHRDRSSAQRTFNHTWGHGGLATRSSSSDGAPPAGSEPAKGEAFLNPSRGFLGFGELLNSVNL